jgi:CRISPR-associated Cas5-like protein
VVITAETPGFSEFAVVSIEEDTPTGTEANAEDTGTDNDGVTTPSEEVSESPTTPVSTPTGIIGILGVLGIIAFLIGRTIKN